ncbi:MAG: AIM24 family protein [Caldilineales bacterium]
MSQYTLDQFITATAQQDAEADPFELENPHLLEVNLNGRVWSKVGAMIAYTGDVTFTREGILEHGLGTMLKRAVSGEGTALMKMDGKGRVYLAERGKKIQILHLRNETIYVNGNDLLALEDSIAYDITMMRRMAGMLAGGLFNVKLSGSGLVAITAHYEPMTLQVRPGQPVFTDPNATVAWAGSLTPEIITQITLRTLIGRGSGEAIQFKFSGEGWVVLQPYEEVYFQSNGSA